LIAHPLLDVLEEAVNASLDTLVAIIKLQKPNEEKKSDDWDDVKSNSLGLVDTCPMARPGTTM